jgi:hypothetical protein
MSGRRAVNRGISHDNQTANEASREGRKDIRNARKVAELYKRYARLQHVMSFQQFKSRLEDTYQAEGEWILVLDLNDRRHPFPKSEQVRVRDFALRLIAGRHLSSPSEPARDGWPQARSRRTPGEFNLHWRGVAQLRVRQI